MVCGFDKSLVNVKDGIFSYVFLVPRSGLFLLMHFLTRFETGRLNCFQQTSILFSGFS